MGILPAYLQLNSCLKCPQALGVVVAESEAAAREGAAAVVVAYADLPAVMSIEDAIAAGSLYEVWVRNQYGVLQC